MEFDMNKPVRVTNRSSGWAGYVIPDLNNLRREFAAGETKTLPYSELVALSNIPGGRALMEEFLQISEIEVINKLDIHTEQEYSMSEAEIIKLMQEGSLDEFLDALDFAPAGVIDIIKTQAVQLPLYDMRKREAILKATGFDVTRAIQNNTPDEDEAQDETPVATRRVQKSAETSETPTRRTESRYKVIED